MFLDFPIFSYDFLFLFPHLTFDMGGAGVFGTHDTSGPPGNVIIRTCSISLDKPLTDP